MKKISLIILGASLSLNTFAQWTNNSSHTSTTKNVGIGISVPVTKLNLVDTQNDPIFRISGKFSNGSPAIQYVEGRNTADFGFETKYNGQDNRFEFNVLVKENEKKNSMTILRPSGNIGIGTVIPETRLHIVNNPMVRGNNYFIDNNVDFTLEDTDYALFNIVGRRAGGIHFSDNNNRYQGGIEYQHGNNTALGGELLFRVKQEKAMVIQYDNFNNALDFELGKTNKDLFRVYAQTYFDAELYSKNVMRIGTPTNWNENQLTNKGLEVYNSSSFNTKMENEGQDHITLISSNTPNGSQFGGITWKSGNRRRAAIAATREHDDSDYVGLAFYTQGTDGPGPFAESMRITRNGNVGIGTTTPQNKLSVNGTLWAKKIKTSLTDAADWVFEEDYNLRSLEEVESYVNENKHLPEIPSAQEFANQGVDLADLNNKLLMKVEELTLYTIAQEKEIKALKASSTQLNQLQKELEELKALLITK